MKKRFILTTLLLVFLIAVVDSMASYKCEKDEENDREKPDLRLKLPNDTIADTTSTKEYLCNVKTKDEVKTLKCNEWEKSYPTSSTASSTTKKKNIKRVEKRYTLTEIILVAFCCLLLGILLTTLVFSLNMKRRMTVCFSKHIKDIQCDSKQQTGPDMQFPTESCVVKKYYPNSSKSAYLKNKNKAEESQYQSFNSIQVVNDQQIYDECIVNEPRSDRESHQSSYSCSQ